MTHRSKRFRRVSLLTAMLAAAIVVTLSGAGTATAATTKTCNLDSTHWATITIHLNASSLYGYSVFYGRSGGWTYGTHNNEHVYATEFHYWDSPDSGSGGVWINRDAMPDAARTIVWFDFQAVGDHANVSDPICTIRFSKGPDY
jgi:hypothetical protein